MATYEGSGTYADVERVVANNVRVAKKKFKPRHQKTAPIEADFLVSFNHQNIIKFLVP